MDPDQIRDAVEKEFPELEIRERRNPQGWAFWIPRGKQRKAIRVFRALRKSNSSEIKWSASDQIEIWDKPVDALIKKVSIELELCSNDSNAKPKGIPKGLSRKHLLESIEALDQGADHSFSDSTGYDVLHNGRRYAPKAVVGLAAELLTGGQFDPYDFKGGLGSKCFMTLEESGFEIITKGDTDPFPDEIDNKETYKEGSSSQVIVNKYERDPRARKKCIEHFGAACQVCEMDFENLYGAIGTGFIHVHHCKQLSEIGDEYEVNPIADLIPVCPNCHAMLHKRKPPYTVEELKEKMENVHSLA